jgi:hypothetical protein
MTSRAVKAYRGAVDKTSRAMEWAGDQVKRDRAQTAAYKARQAESAPKAKAESRTPNYEPVAVQGVRKLKHKSAEAIRAIEEG